MKMIDLCVLFFIGIISHPLDFYKKLTIDASQVTSLGCGSSSGELEVLMNPTNNRHFVRQLPSWTEVEMSLDTVLILFQVFGVAGGIITLVTGASVASFFEIIYFLTVRFWEEGNKVGESCL